MTTGKKNRGGKWNHELQRTLDAGLAGTLKSCFFFHHPVAKPKIINATIRPPLCIEISVDGGITKREWREKPSGWKGNYRTVLLLLSG